MVGNENASKVTIDEAIAFTEAVKNTFQNEREKYDEFVDVLKKYTAYKIDIGSAVARLKEVFKGHQKLIMDFGTFLPSGYNRTTLERKEEKHVTFEVACSFVGKLKARFKGNDIRVHEAFIHNLNMYHSGSKSILDIFHQFGILFWDHPDLLVELNRFLPASYKGPAREGGITMLCKALHI